jgi:hypothetical protein|tara:strand:- start:2385 stop:2819 length:435 start_codon:yes stop_codon:yes gene_type:complete
MPPSEAPRQRPPTSSKLVRINTATLADLESVRAFWFPPTRWCPTCRTFHPKAAVAQTFPDELDEKERPIVVWTCEVCGTDFPRGWPRRKWEPAPPSWNEFLLLVAGDLLHSAAKCVACRRHFRCDYCAGLSSTEILIGHREEEQ